MNIQTTLQSTIEELLKLQEIISKLSEKGSLDLITDGMSHKDQIELNLNLAYTLSSVYYSYLRLNQVDTAQHPISNELLRIQAAFQKYNPQPISQGQQKQMQINKDAAKRMIQPNLKKLDNDENYKQKQSKLVEEERNTATRLDVVHDIWEDDGKAQNKQKLIRGNLIPQTGHLKWKEEIERIMKKNMIQDQQKYTQLQQQQKEAKEYAKRQNRTIYGVPFEYFVEDKKINGETSFGMKTIQDLLTYLNTPPQQANQRFQDQNEDNKLATRNFLAFDSKEENGILGHSLLLRDVKTVYAKNVVSDSMAYIHVFGKQNIFTYYVDKKDTTVEDVIQKFNTEAEIKIDTKFEKYGIGSRLEPGMQINENILKKPISEYVEDDEGLIRLLSY